MSPFTRRLAMLALLAAVVLVALDPIPGFLESTGHRVLSASALALIAVAGLTAKFASQPLPHEIAKRTLLSAAFLLWSLNQLFPASAWAPAANDLAIILFVLDLGLIVRDEAVRRRQPDEAERPVHPVSASWHCECCSCCRCHSRVA